MPLDLHYTPEALNDLDVIFWFIEEDSPKRAKTYVESIRTFCRSLCHTPEIGVARDDLRRGLRIFPLQRRVVIAYEIVGDRLDILRVFYGGQDYEAIIDA